MSKPAAAQAHRRPRESGEEKSCPARTENRPKRTAVTHAQDTEREKKKEMPIRYIIDAEPEQAEALSRALGEISVSFDRQLNLCAMIQENELEQIFQGHDLEMLVEKANEYLEEEDHPLRFRRDLDQLDDLQALYDFLMLMTMHSDWYDIYKGINEISSTEMESFREKHPITMHPAQEEPAQGNEHRGMGR